MVTPLKLVSYHTRGELVINCGNVTSVFEDTNVHGDHYTTIHFSEGESVQVTQSVDEVNQLITETLHGLHSVPSPEEAEELLGVEEPPAIEDPLAIEEPLVVGEPQIVEESSDDDGSDEELAKKLEEEALEEEKTNPYHHRPPSNWRWK